MRLKIFPVTRQINMDSPSILAADLKNILTAKDDQELFDLLLPSTERLIRFFSFAADDETWSSQHEPFLKLTLNWVTNQYAQNRLGENYAKSVVNSLHEHVSILGPLLPRPLEVEVDQTKLGVNPLVIGAMSPYFKNLIRKEGQDRTIRILSIPERDAALATQVLNYMETANGENIWRLEREKVVALFRLAEKWGVEGLASACEDVLKRYITFENVDEELVLSFKRGRRVLLERTIEVFNEKYPGGKIFSPQKDQLIFQFFTFDEGELPFQAVKNEVTHLHFSGNLTLDERFVAKLNECKQLCGLDLSQSNEWSPLLQQIPAKVQELTLSECSWLGDRELRLIAGYNPRINALSLAQNTQISYRGFSELKKFQALRTLDLSRCQLDDETFDLILQGAPGLIALNLYGCRRLSDEAFYAIGKRVPHMQTLKISRTQLTDGALSDIAQKCPELSHIEVDHCLNLSETGLLDFLKRAKNLRYLSIKENHLDRGVVDSFKQSFPSLAVSF